MAFTTMTPRIYPIILNIFIPSATKVGSKPSVDGINSSKLVFWENSTKVDDEAEFEEYWDLTKTDDLICSELQCSTPQWAQNTRIQGEDRVLHIHTRNHTPQRVCMSTRHTHTYCTGSGVANRERKNVKFSVITMPKLVEFRTAGGWDAPMHERKKISKKKWFFEKLSLFFWNLAFWKSTNIELMFSSWNADFFSQALDIMLFWFFGTIFLAKSTKSAEKTRNDQMNRLSQLSSKNPVAIESYDRKSENFAEKHPILQEEQISSYFRVFEK